MGYKSSAFKRRKLSGASAGLAKASNTAEVTLSAARATSADSSKRKEDLFTTKRVFRNAVALAKQINPFGNKFKNATAASNSFAKKKDIHLTTKSRLRNALALTQETCPIITKANGLERRKATARAGAKKVGQQGGQKRNNRSSKVKADQTPTPTACRKFEARTLYNVKSIPGKGLGMVATKNLRRGTRIISEAPFFSLAERPVVSLSDPYAPNDIFEAFHCLTASEQFKYMGLNCPERTDCSLIVSIYEANCYEMGAGTCICLDTSRINHSCIPNAHYSWNETIKRITVHAVKDIAKDEEITISYCSAMRTHGERKRELKPYVFTCGCPACRTDTDFASSSRIRRQQMIDLDHEIADYQNDPTTARAEYGHCDESSAIFRLISLIDEEGLVYEKSLAYHDAAEWALKRGLRENAMEYASKELEVDLCCVGRDSPFSMGTRSFFLRIYFGAEKA